ncbi:uncharacterized protein [Amphiura filiformis]|uniref:uncharacterized protein n=1 Tax=Amphiura filiformis TaxID=82378 RepID=UPI003B211703
MTDTGQEEIDPDSKQYKIDNQDWKKSKVHSPHRDEDKPPPRGRGRGWRTRTRESPTPGNKPVDKDRGQSSLDNPPGNKQVDKDRSRGQRSSDHPRDARRKDDKQEDARRIEEETRKRIQEERRREDERRWEEDRGWRSGIKKETSKQQADGTGMRAAEKSRKPRRAAQEVYVPRARRQAQQLYVPKARRQAENTKSEPVKKESQRAANPREPPEKKRIISDQRQQRISKSHQEDMSQKVSSRTDELRHKGDKYMEDTGERHTSRGTLDRTDDVRHTENRYEAGSRDRDGSAAKRQSANKEIEQLSSQSSSQSRNDDEETNKSGLAVGVHLEEPKLCTELPQMEQNEMVEINSECRNEVEDRGISIKPKGDYQDQIDTSQENKANELKHVEVELHDVSRNSTVQTVTSISEPVMQDDSAITKLEQNECEMTDVVCDKVDPGVTEAQMVDNGDTSESVVVAHDHEIDQTLNPCANVDRVDTSVQHSTHGMEVSNDIAVEQTVVSIDDHRSEICIDEEDKDISGTIEDKEQDSRGVMEWEEEEKGDNVKVDEENSISHDQVDINKEPNAADVILGGDSDHQPNEIDRNISADKCRVDDTITSADAATNMALDNESEEERTMTEKANISTADVRADVASEKIGVPNSSQVIESGSEICEEQDKGDICDVHDAESTNDTDEHVGDSESVTVNDTNTVNIDAKTEDNVNIETATNEQKQDDIFHDALTHRESEDYGSSSSDYAADGDVEKSSSSQDDAMDAEEKGGGDGDGEDSWDALFDDKGESLKPEEEQELAEGIGKVKVSLKKPKHDYYNWQPKDNMDYSAFEHVIEVYDFPADFKTPDLVMSFSDFKNKGFDIKWVDDTHALAIFATPLVAQDALGLMNPMFRTRPLALATRESKMKAKKSIEFLKPYKAKPDTTAVAARRLISGALGLRTKVTREQRETERRKLREAKDKKRADRQQTHDIWEGNI